MKLKLILFFSIFSFSLFSQINKDEYSLVVIMQEEGKNILKHIPLHDLKAGKIHNLHGEKLKENTHHIQNEDVQDVKGLASNKVDLEKVKDGTYRKHTIDKDKKETEIYFRLRVADLKNNYVLLGLRHHNNYEAFIISNEDLDQVLSSVEAREIDEIEDILGDEKIMLPYIPFPPAVTRVIVAIGMYAILGYHYVKDNCITLYHKMLNLPEKKLENESDRKA